ncbi:unnamed protein product [Fructobacillus cardui]|nr:unnamed protein product [Fructobacillus cardui]
MNLPNLFMLLLVNVICPILVELILPKLQKWLDRKD